MPNTKISALTDGATANASDRIPIARAGANYYVTPAYIQTYLGLGSLATVTPGTGVAAAAGNAVNATGGFITYGASAPNTSASTVVTAPALGAF